MFTDRSSAPRRRLSRGHEAGRRLDEGQRTYHLYLHSTHVRFFFFGGFYDDWTLTHTPDGFAWGKLQGGSGRCGPVDLGSLESQPGRSAEKARQGQRKRRVKRGEIIVNFLLHPFLFQHHSFFFLLLLDKWLKGFYGNGEEENTTVFVRYFFVYLSLYCSFFALVVGRFTSVNFRLFFCLRVLVIYRSVLC